MVLLSTSCYVRRDHWKPLAAGWLDLSAVTALFRLFPGDFLLDFDETAK